MPGTSAQAGTGRRAGDARRAAFIIVLAGTVLAGAAWALLGSSLLVVRHVRVTGNGGLPAAEVQAAAGIAAGTPLARLDEGAAERRVERIPQILSAQVSRSWPDTVVIAVRARTPELAVASPAGFELVDIDGVVVRTVPARPAGMPLLDSPPGRLRGSPAVRAAVLVLDSLPAGVRDRVTAVTAVTAVGPGIVSLRLRGGITVRWGGTADEAAKATELAALLRAGARYIDVSSPAVAVTGR
jgi:cell division protein FtsQ